MGYVPDVHVSLVTVKNTNASKVYLILSLFRNKRFALNEMFQRNASKFAIFYV